MIRKLLMWLARLQPTKPPVQQGPKYPWLHSDGEPG
jgi:hypothetical protein